VSSKEVNEEMARTKFGRKIARVQPYRTADAVNYEHFPAWSMPLDEQFTQLAFNGIIAHQFYCSEDEILKRGMHVIDAFVQKDPLKAIEIAALARNEDFIRSVNIITLAKASSASLAAFKEYFDKIILTPRDLVQFIDVMRETRGLGRAIKETMNKWIVAKLGEFYAIKYRKQFKDAISVAHTKFDGDGNALLGDYVMGKEETLGAITEQFPAINAVETLKRINPLIDEARAIALIQEHRLDWNAVKGIFHPTAAIWKVLGEQMSAIALVQNLASLERNAGEAFVLDLVARKVTVTFLERGKVFPFTLAQAYMHVASPRIRLAIGKVLDSLALAHDFAKLGKIAVCPDVSGSMTNPLVFNKIIRRAGKHPGFPDANMLAPIQIAAMFAGILCGAMKDARLLAWTDKVYTEQDLFGHDKEWRTPTKIMDRLVHIQGGGTFMELPIQHIVEHDIAIDTLVLITDSEEWGEGWLGHWRRYKQRHPDARAFLIRVDLYPTRPFSGDDCERYGITQIYGFNDMVFKILLQ